MIQSSALLYLPTPQKKKKKKLLFPDDKAQLLQVEE